MSACPSDDRLVAYVGGALESRDSEAIADHLDSCADCRDLVVVATRGGDQRRALSVMDTMVIRGEPPTTDDEAYCPTCNGSFELDRELCPNDGSRLIRLSIPKDSIIGRTLDARYEVESVLGEGGMGTVYRGRQLSIDREVAIKVIHPRLAADRAAVKRFLREARLSSRLGHANVVSVYDFGQTDRVLYLVMELLRGRTLATELVSGPLGAPRAIRIAVQICDALEAAHALGIVHRDLKPSNVILDGERDAVKVLDFGLAKSLVHDTAQVSHSDAIVGTPLYMSPEQLEGDVNDERSDLYALGCLLYEMVNGAPPFRGSSPSAVALKHTTEPMPPLPASVPTPLRVLIGRLLEKSPGARPQSAREVRDALEALRDQPTMPPRRARRWLAAAAIVFVGAAGYGASRILARSSGDPERTARSAPDALIVVPTDAAVSSVPIVLDAPPPPTTNRVAIPPKQKTTKRTHASDAPPSAGTGSVTTPVGSGSGKRRCTDCPF